MIKSILFTCLVAVASADADADALYGVYGYSAVPFGSSTGLDLITQGLDPVTQGALPAYYGYGYPAYGAHGVYGRRKREADADALYTTYGYTGVPFGSSTGLDPITQGLDYATQGVVPHFGYHAGYAGYPYGAGHYYGKREADADALYTTYGYTGVPFGSSTGLDPITQGLDAATQGVVPYFGYHAGYAGYPYGAHAGHYYGKREADADALYTTYGYTGVPFGSSTGLDPITQGLDYATQGVVPHFGYHAGYAGYPYGAGHYYGK